MHSVEVTFQLVMKMICSTKTFECTRICLFRTNYINTRGDEDAELSNIMDRWIVSEEDFLKRLLVSLNRQRSPNNETKLLMTKAWLSDINYGINCVNFSRLIRRRTRRHSYHHENLVSIAQRMADVGDAFELEHRLSNSSATSVSIFWISVAALALMRPSFNS